MKRPMFRWPLGPCLAALAFCAAAGALAAQDGVRIYEEELRVQLDRQIPMAREQGLDVGGWFTFAFMDFNDSEKQRVLRQYDVRLWTSLNLKGVHRAYFRSLFRWNDWNSGTSTSGPDDWNGQEVERAWYQFDYGQLLQNQTGLRPPLAFKVKVGREFTTIGNSLVLSMPMDMVEVDASAGDWRFMGLLGKTITHTSNIDSSTLVSDHQDRCLWGVQATYHGLDRHQPFAYFLNNQDNTKPWGSNPSQQAYEYTSRYVGVGSNGTLILPDLRYATEVVGEFGQTYSNGVTAGRDRIEAMAIDALLEYFFRVPTRPKATVEYLFGSGDKDRKGSATSTVGGNRPGTEDHAFNAFGFRDTGLAFAPRISNLHIYSAGASFYPLEHIRLLKRMEVGTKAFVYQKAQSEGAISDSSATRESPWVGWEWDIFCDWRITSDLTYTIRYGAFEPGSAFESDSCRQFIYTGVTYSF